MPLYEYECEACGSRFEKIRKFSDEPLAVCDKCGKGPVKKLLSSPAIQFKGSGFYITDYARKSGTDAGKESKGSPTSSSGDSNTGSSSGSSASSPTPSASTPASGSTPAKKD
jgi:putative FmdB family regulatory protein